MALSQVLNLYKKKGETPLECLDRFRKSNPRYSKEKMTYAGRLDPMAEGVLLILVGEKIKKKKDFLSLNKTYESEILFGFSTDTFDILGKISGEAKNDILFDIFKKGISKKEIKKFEGTFLQDYPVFSSKTFKGKPLFEYGRGEVSSESILKLPNKRVKISKIQKISFTTISKNKFFKYIKKSIPLVKGNFRQKEILSLWTQKIGKSGIKNYPILKIKVYCSSGTYIRSLADRMGKKLFSSPSLAFSIKRVKVGNYTIAKSIK